MIYKGTIEERARKDAELGINQSDSYVIATLGSQPEFDPVHNLEHATVGGQLQDPTIEEMRQDLRRDEDELARQASAFLLVMFLAALLLVETAGSIYIMKTLGIAGPERFIFGSALAVCIIFTAWLVSRARNRFLAIAALVALCALVVALTIIRVLDNTVEGGSRAVDLASAVIMIGVTIGPAVMAEHVLRLLSPVLPIIRRVWRLRRRIYVATRTRTHASRFVTGLAARREKWQRDSARLHAIYEVAYRAKRADLGHPEPPTPNQPLPA